MRFRHGWSLAAKSGVLLGAYALFLRSPLFPAGVFRLDRSGRVLWTEPPGLPWLGSSLADVPPIAAMYAGTGDPVSAGLGADRLLAAPHVVVGFPIDGPEGEVAG